MIDEFLINHADDSQGEGDHLKENNFLIFSNVAFANGKTTFEHCFLDNSHLIHVGENRRYRCFYLKKKKWKRFFCALRAACLVKVD